MEKREERAARGVLARQRSNARFFQACQGALVLLVLVIYAVNAPMGLPLPRFTVATASLVALLAVTLAWPAPRGLPARALPVDVALLIASAALVLLCVAASSQYDVAYLLTVICIHSFLRMGVRRAGWIFSGVTCVVWVMFLVAARQPLWVVVGREAALAAGVALGALLMTLLRASLREAERSEALVEELRAAQDRLEEAHRAEKDLAVAQERVRLARELHDSVTQSLYSMMLYAEAAGNLLAGGDSGAAAVHVHDIRDTALESLREMRLLVFELHRPALEEGGLSGALQRRLDAVEARGGLEAEMTVEGTEDLNRDCQEELYGIAREALNNVLKHARARMVHVSLHFAEEATGLDIRDDGGGFTPGAGEGLGLKGMRTRAQKIGATLSVTSTPGCGTTVSVRAPRSPNGPSARGAQP